MPDPAFDAIVSGLRAEDAGFVDRLEKLGDPRRKMRLTLAVLLWTVAPLCIVLGGWTGVLVAVIAGGYGTHLMRTPSWRNTMTEPDPRPATIEEAAEIVRNDEALQAATDTAAADDTATDDDARTADSAPTGETRDS
ncbi:DUF3040 domain-containing protein [Actinoplanes sp. NPDC051475]|uniref:DUF3040 domain-containing protein n=1 Tax=Actinoplanes sp. NPDC051475 TaxID=3157225 RepID=UPI00344C0648